MPPRKNAKKDENSGSIAECVNTKVTVVAAPIPAAPTKENKKVKGSRSSVSQITLAESVANTNLVVTSSSSSSLPSLPPLPPLPHPIDSDNISANDLVTPDHFQKNNLNKKRGRKPKGGKIMTNIASSISDVSEIPNIILHLKCHMSDLKMNDTIVNYDYSPSIEDIQSYTPASNIISCSDIISNCNADEGYDNIHDDDYLNNNNKIDHTHISSTCQNTITTLNPLTHQTNCNHTCRNTDISNPHANLECTTATTKPLNASTNVINEKMSKDIMKKINKLKISFHNSEPVQSKGNHRSACFWDTCDFDTQICYIPTSIINDTFQVYGCFCSPECAIAYLLKEHIDTSTKFERLHLIQLLYGGIYQYGKGLKPAPSPQFLLDKYYGNLTIQEYRQLFKGQQMIYVVNKPLTHILPELYEDNNDFLVNSKVIPTNNMKLKKRYKTMIIHE